MRSGEPRTRCQATHAYFSGAVSLPSGRPASSTSSAACLEACRTATRPDSCTAGGSAAAAAASSVLLAGRSSSVSAAARTTGAVRRRVWAARCSCRGTICALQAPGVLVAAAAAAVRGMVPGLAAGKRPARPQPWLQVPSGWGGLAEGVGALAGEHLLGCKGVTTHQCPAQAHPVGGGAQQGQQGNEPPLSKSGGNAPARSRLTAAPAHQAVRGRVWAPAQQPAVWPRTPGPCTRAPRSLERPAAKPRAHRPCRSTRWWARWAARP